MKKTFIQSCRLDVNKIYKGLLTALISMVSFSGLYATNYYVDNINGSNSNNGTSSGTAWFDFTNVNSRTFSPGDQVLLKAGCVWNAELRLKGSGTSSSFIIVDSYGSGNKPKIQRNSQAADRTVFMDDVSYWKVRNLEISNAGDGIRVKYTAKGKSSVYFENLYIHNIDLIVNGSPSTPDGVYYSTGILMYGEGVAKPVSSTDFITTDVRITDCEIAFTTAPITFLHIFTNPSGANTESPWSFKNVLINNNSIHDHKGPISYRDLNNSWFTNNVCRNGGYQALPQGTTGIFCFNIDNVFFEGNVMDLVPNTSSPDQTWIDNEAYCNNTQFYGNLIKNTAGAGLEFLGLSSGAQPPRGSDDYNTNNIVDGNTFFSNGAGALKKINNSGISITGTVSNNIYQSGNTFFNGSTTGFTLSNNNTGTFNNANLAREKAYSSSSVFDATQRAAKAFDGSGSTNWQAASGFANQWIRINFGSDVTFDSVKLSEFGNRTSGYRIEYSSNGITWQTAFTGTTIGASKAVSFTAVTGKMIRLFFTGGSNTPVIYEFEVYKKTGGASGSNLALSRTYNSSSNWDASQTADKACDALTTTNWQAASGSTFNGQWLRVNFGSAVTFNRVTLKEFGNRTTGYRIEYSTNATTWQTAYTGTTIGASTTVNFTSVTGNYARVFFTGGTSTPIIYEFEIYNAAGARPAVVKQQLLSINAETYPLALFPNPSGNSVNAGYKLPAKSKAILYLYDVSGRMVKQLNFISANSPSGKINIDLTGLNNGVYMVQIKAGNHLINHKLIIQK